MPSWRVIVKTLMFDTDKTPTVHPSVPSNDVAFVAKVRVPVSKRGEFIVYVLAEVFVNVIFCQVTPPQSNVMDVLLNVRVPVTIPVEPIIGPML